MLSPNVFHNILLQRERDRCPPLSFPFYILFILYSNGRFFINTDGMSVFQRVEKLVAKSIKSFGQAFTKACRGHGDSVTVSRSAEREISFCLKNAGGEKKQSCVTVFSWGTHVLGFPIVFFDKLKYRRRVGICSAYIIYYPQFREIQAPLFCPVLNGLQPPSAVFFCFFRLLFRFCRTRPPAYPKESLSHSI